jgi:transcriptional regulator with XRE-family HTH domain
LRSRTSFRSTPWTSRRLRERQGWKQEELAGKLGWSLATVASVETARRNPPCGFPEKADQAFGLPGTLEHLAELVRSTPRWFEHYIELEAQATRINIWSMNLVPGLFQTADYTRTVMHAGRPRDAHEVIEVDVAERIRRQSILDKPSTPMVWAVFHETAVKQPTGTLEITRAQLQCLLALSRRPNVRIQILPLTSSEHAGSDGRFTVFDFADHPSVAFAEGRGSGRLIDQNRELEEVSLT